MSSAAGVAVACWPELKPLCPTWVLYPCSREKEMTFYKGKCVTPCDAYEVLLPHVHNHHTYADWYARGTNRYRQRIYHSQILFNLNKIGWQPRTIKSKELAASSETFFQLQETVGTLQTSSYRDNIRYEIIFLRLTEKQHAAIINKHKSNTCKSQHLTEIRKSSQSKLSLCKMFCMVIQEKTLQVALILKGNKERPREHKSLICTCLDTGYLLLFDLG